MLLLSMTSGQNVKRPAKTLVQCVARNTRMVSAAGEVVNGKVAAALLILTGNLGNFRRLFNPGQPSIMREETFASAVDVGYGIGNPNIKHD